MFKVKFGYMLFHAPSIIFDFQHCSFLLFLVPQNFATLNVKMGANAQTEHVLALLVGLDMPVRLVRVLHRNRIQNDTKFILQICTSIYIMFH